MGQAQVSAAREFDRWERWDSFHGPLPPRALRIAEDYRGHIPAQPPAWESRTCGEGGGMVVEVSILMKLLVMRRWEGTAFVIGSVFCFFKLISFSFILQRNRAVSHEVSSVLSSAIKGNAASRVRSVVLSPHVMLVFPFFCIELEALCFEGIRRCPNTVAIQTSAIQ